MLCWCGAGGGEGVGLDVKVEMIFGGFIGVYGGILVSKVCTTILNCLFWPPTVQCTSVKLVFRIVAFVK